MSTWRRWVKYGQARLRAALSEGNAELDRREAALEAEAADKPWLRSTATSPTVEDVRARVEHDAAKRDANRTMAASDPAGMSKPARDDPDLDFDLREQKRRADDRLAAIRDELGLGATSGDGKTDDSDEDRR